MSDENKKDEEGVTVDAEPVASEPEDMQTKPPGGSSAAIAWIALLLAIGSGGASYYLWQQQASVAPETDESANRIEVILDTTEQQFAETQNRLSATDERLTTAEGGLMETRAQLADYQANLESLRQSLTNAQSQLEQTRRQISEQVAATAEAAPAVENIGTRLAELEGSVDRLRTNVESRQEDLAQQVAAVRQAVEDDLQRVAELQGGLENIVNSLHKHLGANPDAWRLMEVQFLLRTASHLVEFQRDPAAAATALGRADEDLQALGDPAYLPVREHIARDIAALNSVSGPDFSSVALQLALLAERSGTLMLKEGETPDFDGGRAAEHFRDVDLKRDWKELPGIIGAAMKDLVQVRRRGETENIMLAPDEEYFIFQNLRLKLETARLAWLSRDEANFHRSLTDAQAWLEQYFDTDSESAQPFMEEIAVLIETPAIPELPDISDTVRLLRQIMSITFPDLATSGAPDQ